MREKRPSSIRTAEQMRQIMEAMIQSGTDPDEWMREMSQRHVQLFGYLPDEEPGDTQP